MGGWLILGICSSVSRDGAKYSDITESFRQPVESDHTYNPIPPSEAMSDNKSDPGSRFKHDRTPTPLTDKEMRDCIQKTFNRVSVLSVSHVNGAILITSRT